MELLLVYCAINTLADIKYAATRKTAIGSVEAAAPSNSDAASSEALDRRSSERVATAASRTTSNYPSQTIVPASAAASSYGSGLADSEFSIKDSAPGEERNSRSCS